ncbi:MAG: phospholipase [Planctomycetota bacterium]|nr:phospholipase [Planctomycetota bacterium]
MAYPSTIVFVHGWSVTNTDTYGGLPERLAAEASTAGHALKVHELHLAKYVSFHNEVRVEDIARGMEAAVRRELGDLIARGERFAVVTHSTGGPVARAWWWDHYATKRDSGPCPMSHLVMLAPANFGSALAQLGSGRLSRLKSWAGGIEPGTGVLDWLEHGSRESWSLNEAWIRGRFPKPAAGGAYSFVLTGQRVDRKLYDHLNSYTGELGSDGVVRVPAANLNAGMLRLEQGSGEESAVLKPVGRLLRAPATAFRLISGASHSGEDLGIMRAVSPRAKGAGGETSAAILRCLEVADDDRYDALCKEFAAETAQIQQRERVELQKIPVLPDRSYIHDRTSLVIFRVRDDAGHPLQDFDLELSGANNDPDLLPEGFFKDRQRNLRAKNVLSYFFNHDLMTESEAVLDPRDAREVLRKARPGTNQLGLRITPRPSTGFVHYRSCSVTADPKTLRAVIRPNETALVDVVLRRIVHREVFETDRGDARRGDFRKVKPGDETLS